MDTRCYINGLHVRRRSDSSHDVDAMGHSFSANLEFSIASSIGLGVKGGGGGRRMN